MSQTATERAQNRYVATFNDEGEWEIQLAPDADLNDLRALAPIAQAIYEFARG